MSRTDKDRPYRVKLADETLVREEYHDHTPTYRYCVTSVEEVEEREWLPLAGTYFTERWIRLRRRPHAYEPRCALDGWEPGRYRSYLRARCGYSLGWCEHPFKDSPPGDWIREVWWGPERCRERDVLRGLAREYNAHGDVDDADFVNRQHRHSSAWDWW